MRRADRLFQLVQILRNKKQITAHDLAERLEVSERTIYRDVQDLMSSGVPIDGEAGVGYRLRYSLDIPPIMFNANEIEALVIGARMVEAWGGTELGDSTCSLLDKVYAVIPKELRNQLDNTRLYAPQLSSRKDLHTTIDICREAIDQRHYLQLYYQSEDESFSERKVKPLGLFFWGNVWTLTAWCELREGFRSFRLDRIQNITTLDETFKEDPTHNLDGFLARFSNKSLKRS